MAGIGGILVVTGTLMFLKPSRYWVWLLPFVIGGLLFLGVSSTVDGPPNGECLNNLFEPNCSILLPISDDSGQITARIVSGNLEIAFRNGQGYTGVVFRFTSALDVQQFTHVDISGTATQDFKLTIEYKIREGNTAKVVKSSEFHLFPAAIGASTTQIPLTFAGKVDEIALMFYVPGEASEVTFGSIRLSK